MNWQHSVQNWIRVVQKPVRKDPETGRTILNFEEQPVTRYKATCTNNDGTEIACYAENERALHGLMRLHMHAVIDRG